MSIRRCTLVWMIGLFLSSIPAMVRAQPRLSQRVLVDPRDRQAVLAFYRDQYVLTNPPTMNWTGDYETCAAGTIDPAYQDATLRRINYYRAMAGLAPVALDATFSAKAQQSALMTSINTQLNHSPPPTWLCYTTGGAEAAGKSNLTFGTAWTAIDYYVRDGGSANADVGHRGWILHPPTQKMGVGDVPGRTGNGAANTTWVWDEHLQDPAVPTRDPCVAWPPAGYAPYTVVWPRWSCSIADADFTNATVTMAENGAPITLAVDHAGTNGTRMGMLVWRPFNMSHAILWPRPTEDMTYAITISNVLIGGQSQTIAYTTTVIDLNQAPTALQLNQAAPLVENQPAGTVVGTLNTSDPDAGDTFSYQLVAGDGDADNALFAITGSTLKTAGILNYEDQITYTIRIRTSDPRGAALEQALQLDVRNANETPTAIALSPASIGELAPFYEPIGGLTVDDPDTDDQHTLRLVEGPGGDDNGRFLIVSNTLVLSTVLDYETQPFYHIRVEARDTGGLSITTPTTVTIVDENEAPFFISMPVSTTIPISEPWSLTLVARDRDAGDQIMFDPRDFPAWASFITTTVDVTGTATITITGTPTTFDLWDATVYIADRGGLLGALAVRFKAVEAVVEPKRLYFPFVNGR